MGRFDVAALAANNLTETAAVKLIWFGRYAQAQASNHDFTMEQLAQFYEIEKNNSEVVTNMKKALRSAGFSQNTPLSDTFTSLTSLIKTLPASDHAQWTLAVACISAFTFITLLTMILRFYSRHFLKGALRLEDYLTMIAFALSIPQTIIFIAEITWVMSAPPGAHIWSFTYNDLKTYTYHAKNVEYFYFTALYFVKMGFLTFYFTLSPHKLFRMCVVTFFIANTAAQLSGYLGLSLICRPYDYWNFPLTAKCGKKLAMVMFFAVGSMLLDLAIYMLPWPVVLRLKLKPREKFIVLGMFGAGAFCVASSIIRITKIRAYTEGVDVLVDQVPLAIWSIVEVDSAIIISNIPALKHVVVRFWPHILSRKESVGGSPVQESEEMPQGPQRLQPIGRKNWWSQMVVSLGTNRHVPPKDMENSGSSGTQYTELSTLKSGNSKEESKHGVVMSSFTEKDSGGEVRRDVT